MEAHRVMVCDLEEAIQHLPEFAARIGFKLERSKLALVKPNICGLYHPSLDLLSKVVEFLSSNVESIVIGETRSMIHDPQEQFERLGIDDLLKRFKGLVSSVDLSDGEWIRISIPNPHALREIDLPKAVLDSDVLVNVPKVGAHSTTRLTCALKNLFGLLPQKRKYSVYHPLGMDRVIADIAQVVKPDLNVVDAHSKVILGVDSLAVDAIACGFLSLDPLEVEHLRIVSEDRNEKLEVLMKNISMIEV